MLNGTDAPLSRLMGGFGGGPTADGFFRRSHRDGAARNIRIRTFEGFMTVHVVPHLAKKTWG